MRGLHLDELIGRYRTDAFAVHQNVRDFIAVICGNRIVLIVAVGDAAGTVRADAAANACLGRNRMLFSGDIAARTLQDRESCIRFAKCASVSASSLEGIVARLCIRIDPYALVTDIDFGRLLPLFICNRPVYLAENIVAVGIIGIYYGYRTAVHAGPAGKIDLNGNNGRQFFLRCACREDSHAAYRHKRQQQRYDSFHPFQMYHSRKLEFVNV